MSLLSPQLALPAPLPAGEAVLWQGRPQWRGLANHAFHARKVALYFGLLATWRIASDLSSGHGSLVTGTSVLWLFVPAVAACGVLMLLAWLSSRTSQYTITNRRIIMQFGIALPTTLNIPFRVLAAGALRCYADGTGDIPVAISGDDRVAYLMMWPHVRPWRAARAEPMLRSVEDARRVSEILARAVVAAANATGSVVSMTARDSVPSGASTVSQPSAAAA